MAVNVGNRLSETARRDPRGVAVVEPGERDSHGKRIYRQVSFAELEEDATRIAAGLQRMGVKQGMRLVLLVQPGIDFISLVFALFKAGVVTILIDPGMGKKNLVQCLAEAEPEGFVAIPRAQAARRMFRRRFRKARFNVTVGSTWLGGMTLKKLRRTPVERFEAVSTSADDHAAIIFTTGSTGPPKGVLYRHGNFDTQVTEIRDMYGIEPGEVDVPGFPLFALFNAAMGVTTVIPDMDFTRPAQADPRNIVEAVRDWDATQAFGSPALWNTVGRYCHESEVHLPTLRRVLSAGAPVPPHVLERMKNAIHVEGDMHTPYGATESLPVATISASTVLGETAAKSAVGAGTCVGSRFPGIEWRVIRITDDPIKHIEQTEQLPEGEIGEVIVRGAVVTTEYVTRTDANPLHKIPDPEGFWHRLGDVGYLDDQNRFWFCGRKAHRVRTPHRDMYTIPCEAIFNQHEHIYRSALVGVGDPGHQSPVIIVEPWPEHYPTGDRQREQLFAELWDRAAASKLTRDIREILLHSSLPVDIRHNSKIFREQLAEWASEQLSS